MSAHAHAHSVTNIDRISDDTIILNLVTRIYGERMTIERLRLKLKQYMDVPVGITPVSDDRMREFVTEDRYHHRKDHKHSVTEDEIWRILKSPDGRKRYIQMVREVNHDTP